MEATAASVNSCTNGASKSRYRPEIDGLRAFAVVAVIINHFNKDLLPSGYLGVDIFFVISGYVITSSLAGRQSKNFLDFLMGFYERRIKRLLPALVVFVLITSVLISLFNPNPDVSLGLGWRALFGISNINLYQGSTDYFAQSTELNPFTHTWSLGVEEQFYLLFPFLIWFSGFGQQRVKGARNLFFWAGAMTIVSIISFIYLYPVNQPAAYFLMPSRFWEMAAGCLIFIGYQKRAKVEATLELVPPFLVVAMIVGVMFLPIEAAIPATISIVVLSAVLVACLKKGTAAFYFFTLEKVVYVGLISFSLYLWHWSVLSVSRWTIGIHWWSVPIQVGLMVLMAMASYKWVETPLRRKIWFPRRWATLLAGVVLTIVSASFVWTIGRQPKNSLFLGSENQPIEGFEDRFTNGEITAQKCLDSKETSKLISACIEKYNHNESARIIWLAGDSHAFTLLNGIRKLAAEHKFNLRVISRRGTAFPAPKSYLLRLRTVGSQEALISNLYMDRALNVITDKAKAGDVLIVGLKFPMHFGTDTFEYEENNVTYRSSEAAAINGSKRRFFSEWLVEIERLTVMLRSKGANLIILGPVSQWAGEDAHTRCDGQWFRIPPSECLSPRSYQDRLHREAISRLKKLSQRHSNFRMVDISDQICGPKVCSFNDHKGKNLYWDDDHLSDYAAINYVVPAIMRVLVPSNDKYSSSSKFAGEETKGVPENRSLTRSAPMKSNTRT